MAFAKIFSASELHLQLRNQWKLSPEAAYEEISELWQHLKQSKATQP